MPQNTLRIDDKKPTKSDTFILYENAIVTGNFHVSIGDQRKHEVGAQATFLAALAGPSKVRKFRVSRNAWCCSC